MLTAESPKPKAEYQRTKANNVCAEPSLARARPVVSEGGETE